MKNQLLQQESLIPEFIRKPKFLFIPKKAHKKLKEIKDEEFKRIHNNSNTARELCLYFLSLLTSTIYENEFDRQGKHLNSSILQKMFRPNNSKNKDNSIYARIIELLERHSFIYVDRSYAVGAYSRKYFLNEDYRTGHAKYRLKTPTVKAIVYRNILEQLAKAQVNPIARNLLTLYPRLELPTIECLLEKGKALTKSDFKTKKGKKLTMRYRKPNSYWSDSSERAFVEDHIARYDYYTSSGFMIPIIGGEHCPRVYDSLSLLPSWIRNEIKYDGKPLYEADYKCLHPNLIMTIYKGSTKYLTHSGVERITGVEDVKIKHLSLFNLEQSHFKGSKLYHFYKNIEPEVTSNVLRDKDNHGYKITSKLLFTLEAELMTKVIEKLNAKGIYVPYIYDALLTTRANSKEVVKIMNETALELNIYTVAEFSTES